MSDEFSRDDAVSEKKCCHAEREEHEDERKERIKGIITVAAASVLLVTGLLLKHFVPNNVYLYVFVFLLAFLIPGFDIIKEAFEKIRDGDFFNEDTLMIVASVGAFIIGEYPEAVFVIIFYTVGEMFEEYAEDRSRRSIGAMLDLRPDSAELITPDGAKTVAPQDVHPGDLIRIAPGARIPLDGIVEFGSSFLDTSAVTGESVPREVNRGDAALSGCINGGGALNVRVTKEFNDSTLSKMLELVEESGEKKSVNEKFITKFAKYYTPIVMVLALLIAVIPPLVIKDASFKDYIYRALSFLVVSCPCALVISVPLAYFSGIGASAKNGILIKGGTYMDRLLEMKSAVFDKTGTLTKGVFKVVDVVCTDGVDEDEFLMYSAYAEVSSSHPIAKSITDAYGKEIDRNRIGSVEEISGKGIKAVVNGRTVLTGNSRLLIENGIKTPDLDGDTVVYTAVDGVYFGAAVISDEIKDDSFELVDGLKEKNIKTYILTGDTKRSAERIADELKTDECYSLLLPDKKVETLEKIMENTVGGSTVYVGDGINDAPVLARSDVGVAMGAMGSDAAIEAADIVIMNDEPSKLLRALEISKKTARIARQNIILSILVKVAVLALCSVNILHMDAAVFADVGVMVLAVINSTRAMK